MAESTCSEELCKGMATLTVHAGQSPEVWNTGAAVVPPITLSTTYRLQEPSGASDSYVYNRIGNPTRSCFEAALAAVEKAKYGFVFSSGMATIFTITQLLESGDHIVSFDSIYGGTVLLLKTVAAKLKTEITFIPVTDDPEIFKQAIKPNTKMVLIESPNNPLLNIVDIRRIADTVHQFKDVFVIIDSTFASPACQRPLELGVDLVMHSVSKYINGHTDVIMGGVVTNRDDLYEKIKFLQKVTGAIPSPFDCYVANRGLKTLPLRMAKHQHNAMAISKYLEFNSKIEEVLYLGLPSHPQHELAKKQMFAFGGMIALKIKGGKTEAVNFMNNLKLIISAASLGSIESLIEHP
ncbi:cystathionine gamma-lyase-like [Saccoglossus kowalevskii]